MVDSGMGHRPDAAGRCFAGGMEAAGHNAGGRRLPGRGVHRDVALGLDRRAVSTGSERGAWILGISGTGPHDRPGRLVAGPLPGDDRHQPHSLARPAAASAGPLGAYGLHRSRRRISRGARHGKRPLEIRRVELRAEAAAGGLSACATSG